MTKDEREKAYQVIAQTLPRLSDRALSYILGVSEAYADQTREEADHAHEGTT